MTLGPPKGGPYESQVKTVRPDGGEYYVNRTPPHPPIFTYVLQMQGLGDPTDVCIANTGLKVACFQLLTHVSVSY